MNATMFAEVPSAIRAQAVIALGMLCLWSRAVLAGPLCCILGQCM
jgi:hypothetical protein